MEAEARSGVKKEWQREGLPEKDVAPEWVPRGVIRQPIGGLKVRLEGRLGVAVPHPSDPAPPRLGHRTHPTGCLA